MCFSVSLDSELGVVLELQPNKGDSDYSPASGATHAHLSVSAVVLEAVLQHTLVLLHQVVPAVVRGRRGALVPGGDRGGGGSV